MSLKRLMTSIALIPYQLTQKLVMLAEFLAQKRLEQEICHLLNKSLKRI